MMDFALFVTCGLVSGFLAGLLGIGGGFVVVPVMMLLLPPEVVPAAGLPQMAVATSLAAMVPTTIAALRAQWRRGAVDMPWLRRLAPGVCAGALAGALLLPHTDPRAVAAVFLAYAGYFALRLLLGLRGIVLPTPWTRWPVWLAATVLGCVSVLAGVGGAIFTVPYLESRALPITRAVATSSGVGLLLSSVAVACLLVVTAARGAAPGAGLVWWPAALAIAVAAVAAAPLGVRAAHHLPVGQLKGAFAVLLMAAALGSLWKVHAL